MIQWAELATLMMLGLATFCVFAALYYTRMAGNLVVRLATDCVHLKMLIGIAAGELIDRGVVEIVQASDAEKAKMN